MLNMQGNVKNVFNRSKQKIFDGGFSIIQGSYLYKDRFYKSECQFFTSSWLMIATECQYCQVKSYLTCCLKVPILEPLNVICEPCMRDVLKSWGQIPCSKCNDPCRSDIARIKQILTREDTMMMKFGPCQKKDLKQDNLMTGYSNRLIQPCNLFNYQPPNPQNRSSSNIFESQNQPQFIAPPQHRSSNSIFNIPLLNKSKIFYNPEEQKKKQTSFSLFNIEEEKQIKFSQEELQNFNEASAAPIDQSARLAYERKKSAPHTKEKSINFSDTSTYRDLQR